MRALTRLPLAALLAASTALAQQPGPIWNGTQFDTNTIIMNSAKTGQAPGITVGGQTSDPNIDLNISPKGNGHVNITNLNSSLQPVTPSGGTTASSLANLTSRFITPYDFGGYGDAKRQQCTISTSGNALTINSGGCSFTAADVGKLVVVFGVGSSSILPYASTITAVTDATHITVGGAGFGQTLSSSSQRVVWGHDDAAAINAMIVASTSASQNVCATIPNALWMAGSQIVLDPGGKPACLRFATGAWVLAGAQMAQLVYRDTTFMPVGGNYDDVAFDGQKLATNVAFLACAAWMKFARPQFDNAAPDTGTATANLVVGDGVTPGCGGDRFVLLRAHNFPNLYASGGADEPRYTVVVNATDTRWIAPQGINASNTLMYVAASAFNTDIVSPHFWADTGYEPNITYSLNAFSTIHDPVIDGVKQIGVDVNGDGIQVLGGHVERPTSGTTTVGVQIEAGSTNFTVMGFDAADAITTAANRVVLLATGNATKGHIFSNPGATDYNMMATRPLADLTSIGLGGSALSSLSSTAAAYADLAIGDSALLNCVTCQSQVALGASALQRSTANNNTAIGAFSGVYVTNGAENTFVGTGSGGTASTTGLTGGSNTGVGKSALSHVQGGGGFNTAYGHNACNVIATGTNNTCVGAEVGTTTLTGGSRNILIGTSNATDTQFTNTNDEINIGNLLFWNNNSQAAPALSACGTSPAMDAHANNHSGTVTAGSGALASCTMTFAGTGYSTWNHCRVTSQAAVASFAYSYTLTTLTVTGTSITSDKFDYDCDGL